jgi:hypothetical protein
MITTPRHTTMHEGLSLVTLDAEGHARTCSYWYLVRKNSGPHTAFRRRESLLEWLDARGLTLTAELPEHGVWSRQPIEGAYFDVSHRSYDAVLLMDPALVVADIRVLSNGSYTLGRITRSYGRRAVHYLNVINTTVEGAAAPVLVSDCQSCPLLDVAPPTSPLHRRGYIGRCLLSRAESTSRAWTAAGSCEVTHDLLPQVRRRAPPRARGSRPAPLRCLRRSRAPVLEGARHRCRGPRLA